MFPSRQGSFSLPAAQGGGRYLLFKTGWGRTDEQLGDVGLTDTVGKGGHPFGMPRVMD